MPSFDDDIRVYYFYICKIVIDAWDEVNRLQS